MSRSGLGLGGGRLAAVALAIGLVVILAGDGGRAATVPAVINGQDPLEVLALKVRPNVVIVLDSSGSMKWTLDPNHGTTGSPVNSGDHPRSKLWQAKQVLKTIVEETEDRASYLFGQYTQGGGATMQNRTTSAGQNRFIYWTTDDAFPSMGTDELSVQRALDDPGGSDRGLQSWQVIYQEWGTLWFEEDNGAVCEATLPGPFPAFYSRGGSGTSPAVSTSPQNLSFDLQTAMNNASCTGGSSGNTYQVSYSDGEFRFSADRRQPVPAPEPGGHRHQQHLRGPRWLQHHRLRGRRVRGRRRWGLHGEHQRQLAPSSERWHHGLRYPRPRARERGHLHRLRREPGLVQRHLDGERDLQHVPFPFERTHRRQSLDQQHRDDHLLHRRGRRSHDRRHRPHRGSRNAPLSGGHPAQRQPDLRSRRLGQRVPQHLQRGGPSRHRDLRHQLPAAGRPALQRRDRPGHELGPGVRHDVPRRRRPDQSTHPEPPGSGGQLRGRRRNPGDLHLGRRLLLRRLGFLRRLPDPRGPGALRPAVAPGADPALHDRPLARERGRARHRWLGRQLQRADGRHLGHPDLPFRIRGRDQGLRLHPDRAPRCRTSGGSSAPCGPPGRAARRTWPDRPPTSWTRSGTT